MPEHKLGELASYAETEVKTIRGAGYSDDELSTILTLMLMYLHSDAKKEYLEWEGVR